MIFRIDRYWTSNRGTGVSLIAAGVQPVPCQDDHEEVVECRRGTCYEVCPYMLQIEERERNGDYTECEGDSCEDYQGEWEYWTHFVCVWYLNGERSMMKNLPGFVHCT